jgi:hypothetical protein
VCIENTENWKSSETTLYKWLMVGLVWFLKVVFHWCKMLSIANTCAESNKKISRLSLLRKLFWCNWFSLLP